MILNGTEAVMILKLIAELMLDRDANKALADNYKNERDEYRKALERK